MDRRTSFFKRIPVGFICMGIGLWLGSYFWPHSLPILKEGQEKFAATRWILYGPLADFIDVYRRAWFKVQLKADEMRHAEENNLKLKLENENLKVKLETLQLGCHTHAGQDLTQDYALKLTKETGTRVGRILAGIAYKPPSRLLPAQLYTLGISYLKAHENEKAAVIFTVLTGLQETEAYKNAKDLLMTGVAWYRVENYTLADSYFDEVLKKPEKLDSIQFQAQARLWKALVASKFKKEMKAQYWMKELIDHHPHSVESGWINLPGGEHEQAHSH